MICWDIDAVNMTPPIHVIPATRSAISPLVLMSQYLCRSRERLWLIVDRERSRVSLPYFGTYVVQIQRKEFPLLMLMWSCTATLEDHSYGVSDSHWVKLV
eukprot:scaffold219571_cov23-Cyclotella_meneghiniana.AAC.1